MPPAGSKAIQVNTKAIREYVAKRGGNLDRKMDLIAERVLQEAQIRAPVGKKRPSPGGRMPLRETLYKRRQERNDRVPVYWVASDSPKMDWVVRGTDPHIIVPRRKKALAFWWDKRGVQFVGPVVRHPGNRSPNNFLREAFEAVKSGLR